MTLGAMLTETLKVLEAANLKTLEEKAAADLNKINQEREKLVKMVDSFKNDIETAIKNGRVPLIKEKNFDKKKWIREAVSQKAKHQDVWNNFGNWAKSQALHVMVKEGHDGMGMEDWVTISVEPVRSGYRSSTSSSNSVCNECGLPHGQCDPEGVGHYRG